MRVSACLLLSDSSMYETVFLHFEPHGFVSSVFSPSSSQWSGNDVAYCKSYLFHNTWEFADIQQDHIILNVHSKYRQHLQLFPCLVDSFMVAALKSLLLFPHVKDKV
ncbi:hypothetical protein ILYODFUR_000291 [Ilyodon furcidens]|uniref:Uncharacterized protein n=1 Tax=Ilyodon furcidens TaxID=33524 RepID=A0ABV0TGB0_9TELE